MRKTVVRACAVVCLAAVVLWLFSLGRAAGFGYSWAHESRTPYKGAGYAGVQSSGGVIMLECGVEPLAEPAGWQFSVGHVIPFGSTSESQAVRMGFGADGLGRWGDEYFTRRYMLPWWLIVFATAWAPVVLWRRRRRSESAGVAGDPAGLEDATT